MVNGSDIKIRLIMDIANFALKKKMKKNKEYRKILIFTSYLIAKELVN